MSSGPFKFEWKVDQDGYETTDVSRDMFGRSGEWEGIKPCGGPLRYYRLLDNDGLWLRFADTCRSREGVLRFVGEYGMLHDGGDTVETLMLVAGRLWEIAEKLRAGDRLAAAAMFNTTSLEDPFNLPIMYGCITWSDERPGALDPAVIPRQLDDALKHQALEAITGNRQFRRCRNEGCANWFRLGPRSAKDGGHTYTARREFCSTRCRIAWNRRNKREASAHA
jgi:hypothetical protein